jgi:hypothetical protein
MKPAAAVLLLAFLFGGAATAQNPPADPQAQQLLALAQEVQAQQKQIADNHAKIEAKLVAVAEAVRQARIYASRSGGSK